MDKIYLCVKYPFESKQQVLVNGREKVKTKKLENPNAFIKYSQTKDDVYETLEDYNLEANKKSGPIVIEFFVRRRKLISLVFMLQSYF